MPAFLTMQAFYYVHHIQASELSLEVIEAAPYRLSLAMNPDRGVVFTYSDEVIPVKILVDRNPGFNEPIALELGKKTIYIKLNTASLEASKGKKYLPAWQMNIIGTVKGELVKQGKRTFQNARHREMTPFFMIRLQR